MERPIVYYEEKIKELEKQLDRFTDKNDKLEKKVYFAVKTLRNIIIESEDVDWDDTNIVRLETIEEIATKALKEIEG